MTELSTSKANCELDRGTGLRPSSNRLLALRRQLAASVLFAWVAGVSCSSTSSDVAVSGGSNIGGSAASSGAGLPSSGGTKASDGGASAAREDASGAGGAADIGGDSAGSAAGTTQNEPAGDGTSVSQIIGAKGGTISIAASAGQALLTIPPGALSTDTEIRITETNDPAPAGYTLYSPVYRLEPIGTVFAKPVSIRLPFKGDARLATLFWSRSTGSGYDRIGGIPTGRTLTGSIAHFSKGFIADGVDYTDPPDQSCVVGKLIEGRTSVTSNVGAAIPSSVALFFTVDDCQGRPITGLSCSKYPSACDFSLQEDGAALSSEAGATILPTTGLNVFARLLLDMSSSTADELPQVIAGAKAFVNKLQVNNPQLKVQVGIDLFAGEAGVKAWQAPTLDSNAVLAKLDQLVTYKAPDPSSTNLFGAVAEDLSNLTATEDAFRARNSGGALATGYLVVFTDGADTAGLVTQASALAAVKANQANQVLAVGLRSSPDFSKAAEDSLAALTNQGQGLIPSDDPTTLERDFSALAARIAGQVKRTYLLGYCSPKRTGKHVVAVSVAASKNEASASYDFSATGFGPGCSTTAFSSACDGVECGGLACGSCDDRVGSCSANKCVNFCKQQNECGGVPITNPLGYGQTCNDTPESSKCDGACKDLTTDNLNCGACGVACATNTGASCIAGVCGGCATGKTVCGTACTDTQSDVLNCGGCGVECSAPDGDFRMCIQGHCAVASSLASTTSLAQPLAIRAGNLYWSDAGSIWRVPVGGGTPTNLYTVSAGNSTNDCRDQGLVVDDSNLYWVIGRVGSRTLMRMPIAGGTAVSVGASTTAGCPLALDSNYVYWAGNGGNALIYRAPLVGATLTSIATGTHSPNYETTGLAVDAAALYFGDYGLGTISKVALAGGAASSFVAQTGELSALMVVGNSVYWPERLGTTSVVKQRTTDALSPAVTLLNASGYGFRSITSDKVNIYLGGTSGSTTTVLKLPLAGGAASVVVAGPEMLGGGNAVVDSTSVYFTTRDRIVRATK